MKKDVKEPQEVTSEDERRKAIEAMLDDQDYHKLVERVNKWWVHVKDYVMPNESLSQFSLRCGVGRDEAFNWKTRGRIPRADKMVKIMKNLEIPKDTQKKILFKAVDTPKIENNGHAHTEVNEGYVYPNQDGVNDTDGRIGFKNVFLDTHNIKPESVKLVICDTPAMEPQIKQRDMLLVDMSKTTPQSGRVYLLELDDEPDQQIVCKIASIPGKRYNIIFENKEIMNSYAVSQDNVLIHGEVVFVGRFL